MTDGIYRIVMKCMLIQEHQIVQIGVLTKTLRIFQVQVFQHFFGEEFHIEYIERELVI